MIYSKIIKDILKENKISQQIMADKLGVNQTTISQWILGKKKPSFDNILEIYKIYNITPNELFGVED